MTLSPVHTSRIGHRDRVCPVCGSPPLIPCSTYRTQGISRAAASCAVAFREFGRAVAALGEAMRSTEVKRR